MACHDAYRKKLSHVGTVTWQSKTLKRKTEAPNHVGSGDWLGGNIVILMFLNVLESQGAR